MTATCKMYKYVLVVIDSFTKFTWIFPTKTTTTKETLDKLMIIQQTFGNPRRIISDRGTAFSSNDFAEYCKAEGIDHHMITTGMPRGNGQVERVNRCIIPMLTKTSGDEPEKWYKHVPALQRALNSTFQRSIGMTPFKLLTGVEMKQRNDVRMADGLEKEFMTQFLNEREEDQELAKAQIMRVQEENVKVFNRKRKQPNPYRKGELVAVKRTQFTNGNKFANKFLGPYRVTSVMPNDRYQVMKEGHHEGPAKTSTAAEYMKPWASEADAL